MRKVEFLFNPSPLSLVSLQDFAMRLCDIMTSIGEAVPMKTLSFVNDGCELLVQCHKVRSLILKRVICRSPRVYIPKLSITN